MKNIEHESNRIEAKERNKKCHERQTEFYVEAGTVFDKQYNMARFVEHATSIDIWLLLLFVGFSMCFNVAVCCERQRRLSKVYYLKYFPYSASKLKTVFLSINRSFCTERQEDETKTNRNRLIHLHIFV